MGHKESKHVFNFEQYGLSQSQAEMLENCFNHAVGKHHELKHDKFVEVYLNLYPETDVDHAHKMADHAFAAADTNKNGVLSFDEFAHFYLRYRSRKSDVNINLTNLLSKYNNSGCITRSQAEKYLNLASNCFDRSTAVDDIMKYFNSHGDGDQIPIDVFLSQVTPFYANHDVSE